MGRLRDRSCLAACALALAALPGCVRSLGSGVRYEDTIINFAGPTEWVVFPEIDFRKQPLGYERAESWTFRGPPEGTYFWWESYSLQSRGKSVRDLYIHLDLKTEDGVEVATAELDTCDPQPGFASMLIANMTPKQKYTLTLKVIAAEATYDGAVQVLLFRGALDPP